MKHALFRYLDQLATDRWARQGVRTLLRAIWLGGCIWCIGIGGYLLWGWPLRYNLLGALVLVLIGLGVATLLRPKLSPLEAARRLDRRFNLHEQLATAVEVTQTNPPRESIAALLVAESGRTARHVQHRIGRQQQPPWSELIAVIAIALVAAGLYLIAGIGQVDQDLIGPSAPPLPPLAQPPREQLADEPFTPPQGRQQAGAAGTAGQPGQTGAAGDPQTLGTLADALRDQGATRPAAEALDRGDTAGAARQLRTLADQADQLSETARADLADRLRSAADQIQPRNPGLADQLRQSADGLERGGQAAKKALEDLARAIEQMQTGPSGAPNQAGTNDQSAQPGEQGQPGQPAEAAQGDQRQPSGAGEQGNQGAQAGQGASSGAGNAPAGEQRQAPPGNRLGVEGRPVELDSAGTGQDGRPAPNQAPSTSKAAPGFVQGGQSSDQRVQIGSDPLRIPLDERDVVQEYFAP